MGLLSRFFTATAGNYVKASEINGDFNQLYNTLNGGVTTNRVYIISNDNADPVLRLNQQGSSDIAEFTDAGTVRAVIEQTDQSTTDPTSDNGLITKKFYKRQQKLIITPFFFGGEPQVDDQSPRFIAPNDNIWAKEVRGVCEDKGGSGGASTLVFRVYKQPADGSAASPIGDFTFDNTGNAIVQEKTYSQTLTGSPVDLQTGDSVYIKVQNSDDGKMRKFTIELIAYEAS